MFITRTWSEIQRFAEFFTIELFVLSRFRDFFDYSDFEVKRKKVSFTIETLKEMKRQYDNIEFIIGYDNIFQFHTWKDPDKIFELVKIIVLKRKSSYPPPEKDKYYKAAEFVQTRGIEISATDIRERVKNGLPINYLVTDEVRNYIYRNKLYGAK